MGRIRPRDDSAVDRRLTALIENDGPIAVTQPVVMEVVAGARDDRRETDLRRLLLRFELLSFDAVADFDGAVRIYRRCRAAGITPQRDGRLHDRVGGLAPGSHTARPRRRHRPRRARDRDRTRRSVASRLDRLHGSAPRRLDPRPSRLSVSSALPRPSTCDVAASRTKRNRITAQAISPASRKTAADHAPVASRSTPLTAGDSTAAVSPMRLFMPNAAP